MMMAAAATINRVEKNLFILCFFFSHLQNHLTHRDSTLSQTRLVVMARLQRWPLFVFLDNI